MQDKKEVVVAYLEGTCYVPRELWPIVKKYRELYKITQECVSYPRHIDDQMNKLHDALEVLA